MTAGRYVDLLDAHGQIGPSDFKARLKAAGSRDYGEDVAERNIGENGLLLGSAAVQNFYATQKSHPHAVPSRPSTSLSRYRKQAKKDTILEHPEGEGDVVRPPSRTASLRTNRSMPVSRSRAAAATPEPYCCPETAHPRPPSTTPSQISVLSIGQLKLEGSHARDAAPADESDDAFPPSIPRHRRVGLEDSPKRTSNVGSVRRSEQDLDPQRSPSRLGSVRRARQSIFAQSKGPPDFSSVHDINYYTTRPTSRNHASRNAAQQDHHVMENVTRWRSSLVQVDETPKSPITDRATESRASCRKWSIASTEHTEPSEVSSICNIRPVSRGTANTSITVDLDEKQQGPKPSLEDGAAIDVEASSITTDGSDIDAFLEKRKRRTTPEDEALVFNEQGFFNGRGALPGLFDLFQVLPSPIPEEPAQDEDTASTESDIAEPSHKLVETIVQDLERGSEYRLSGAKQSETQDTAGALSDTVAEDDYRSSSVATPESLPGSFVPKIYLTRRQRLLALGFDYETDDDELAALGSDLEDDNSNNKNNKNHIGKMGDAAGNRGPVSPRIIIESPQTTNERLVTEAAHRRKAAKKANRAGPRLRRIEAKLDDADGNMADVE